MWQLPLLQRRGGACDDARDEIRNVKKQPVTSSILICDPIVNTGRKFGAARLYYPAVIYRSGWTHAALFTEDQIMDAIERARKQPEDAPKPSWLAKLVRLFH